MDKGKNDPTANAHDAAFVAVIAREVMARLSTNGCGLTETVNPLAITERVVTAEQIARLPGTPAEVSVGPKAVVTPAAHDEARRRNIMLRRSATDRVAESPRAHQHTASTPIVDSNRPERAEAVAAQLASRGVTRLDVAVVLSEKPAAEVHHQCKAHGQRAVMVNSISDVARFAAELDPTVWVIDMVRLNFVAAVNAIAQIAKLRRLDQ